ncbi:hypothetical protein TruAng_004782 [Truncatella angustata]|nr:hypothetical protein TruAng_004782 [Truncatella angustata]
MANSTNPDLPKSPVVPLAHTESGSNIGAVPPLPPPVSEPEATLQASTMFAVSTIAEAEKCAQTDIRACALLDLPVDVLRLIVKEVKQANDLITLALTCSTLHSLAIPHIYARFDIVWPESASTPSSSKNVDALTYGLSTLCLGSKFGQRARWLCGGAMAGVGTPGRLVDNQYAKFTRKFGLGNGPHIWVSDYNVTKESGKMLGTLVSLAVAKMVNLETFVWDMPTGVLSDVFMALASLQDDPPGGHCKLEKVHIRWHESWQGPHGTASSESSPVIQPANPVSAPQVYTIQPTSPASHMLTRLSPPKYAESHVEYPTFSVLPPLKSLTVLDINELAYLDEISVLIERSKDTLQELRLGIHHKAIGQDFASAWEGDGLQQVDLNARWPGESAIGDKRLGGVLGVVMTALQVESVSLRKPGQVEMELDTTVCPPKTAPRWVQYHTYLRKTDPRDTQIQSSAQK